MVDGKAVGAVTNGSFIFVDRPPGVYRLGLQIGILNMTFETDVHVDAGRDYFFNIGVPQSGAFGTDMINQAIAGGKGQQMPGRSPLMAPLSGVVFYSLDSETGAAEIERLKAP